MTKRADRDDQLFATRFRPGHFHSPLPSFADIDARAEELFERVPRELPGLELREEEQVGRLTRLVRRYLGEMPRYGMQKQPGLRFHHDNSFFSRKDAALLYCMIRDLRPQRIVEVGSGFSSCIMLDTNERFFDRAIELTFIEPHPERLYENIDAEDARSVRIVEAPVQSVPVSEFERLEANDILFVDSTHVTKLGSDVNRLLFEVLPSLRPGVFVHFHDVFYPFEYPRDWVEEGRAWNEAYILRAFLQYNEAFRIRLFNSFLLRFHPELYDTPEWKPVPGGGSRSSLWLEKTSTRPGLPPESHLRGA